MLTCPICHSTEMGGKVFDFSGYRIWTCRHCFVRFCQPFVDNRAVYTSEFIARKEEYLEPEIPAIPPQLRGYIDGVSKKRILDIGCGAGWFLDSLKESNDVLGLEVSAAYQPILERKGIPCRIGDLEQELAQLPDTHYDLITMWDVFEHLYDPMMMLRLIKRKLTENGLLINWTNNYDDMISRFAELTYRLSFGRMQTFMAQSFNRINGHNYNFVPSTLRYIYDQVGFDILHTLITDTPSDRLTQNMLFKMVLETFYALNRFTGKGKIICHVVKRSCAQG